MKQWMIAASLAVTTIGTGIGTTIGAGTAQAATYVSPGGTRGLTILTYATVGQSFTMVGTQLSSFGFQLQTTINKVPNDPLTFTLREGDGLTGAILRQVSVSPVAGTARANFWQDVDLSGTTLDDGRIYTASLTATTSLLAVLYGPTTGDTIDGYTGGRLLAQKAQTGYCVTGPCDANFRFTTADTAPAVPEPASWALMLLGFGTVGHALRRRPARHARQIA